ncbi:MAG: hypothetical protein J7K46_03780 [Bacteroidales bacterium]|nr:hypothetical protein [Bacteroidales bacterium]
MGIDIKIPIGLLFSILGGMLFIFGLTTGSDPMYHKSLDININLWTGAFMLIFGLFMLMLAALGKKKDKETQKTAEG